MKRCVKDMLAHFVPELERASVSDWDVKLTKNHSRLEFVRRDGSKGTLFFPSTPSDHRAVKNARSQLRRLLVA